MHPSLVCLAHSMGGIKGSLVFVQVGEEESPDCCGTNISGEKSRKNVLGECEASEGIFGGGKLCVWVLEIG